MKTDDLKCMQHRVRHMDMDTGIRRQPGPSQALAPFATAHYEMDLGSSPIAYNQALTAQART
jgi:hypothetical protein